VILEKIRESPRMGRHGLFLGREFLVIYDFALSLKFALNMRFISADSVSAGLATAFASLPWGNFF
jgi:hypothetical protein